MANENSLETSVKNGIIELYRSAHQKIKYMDNLLYINDEPVTQIEKDEKFNSIDEAKDYVRKNIYCNDVFLQNITKSDNLIVLTGAGSSLFNKDSCVSGKTMKQLYDTVFSKQSDDDLKDKNSLFSKINFNEDKDKKNLELLMSRIEIALTYYREGNDFNYINDWNKKIRTIIKEECSFSEKENFDSNFHSIFLSKVISRRSSHNRVKIFTLNYDTAFEHGAERAGIVLIDGFNFSNDGIFNDNFFDYDLVKRKDSRIVEEDNFLPNIAYLYKLHGSIDWYKKDGKIIKSKNNDGDFVMVMPSKNKYEQSYKTPYFNMMARFQTEMRSSWPSTLLIIGYSFGDEHINKMIMEAVNRPNFNIVIVDPKIPTQKDSNDMQKELLKSIPKGNIVFINDIFEDFTNSFPVPKAYDDNIFR